MPKPVLKLIPETRFKAREKIKGPFVVPSVAGPAKWDNAKGVVTPAKAAINHMGRIATLPPTNDARFVPNLLSLGNTGPQDDTVAACIP